MKQFELIFNEHNIIEYLCKARIKIAKQRNKRHLIHLLTGDSNFNYHVNDNIFKPEKEIIEILEKILPSRNKWVKLSPKTRYRDNFQKLNTNDKNYKALIFTVKKFRKKKPEEPFVIELNNYIEKIRSRVIDSEFILPLPDIYPKPKDFKEGISVKECRPLSVFNLDDKLILSLTNKYLTKLFDGYFDDSSLAFRSGSSKNHHTAIRNIRDYRARNNSNFLWVAECDMMKFYDSVDHKVIRKEFDILLNDAKIQYPSLKFDLCKKIFESYLDSYCFNLDVFPKNKTIDYWQTHKIKGEFGWVENEIVRLGLYDDLKMERIGVPQGGALSGLIANVVLNKIDKLIVQKYPDIFYNRFCDDMIIMHSDKQICSEAIELYKSTITDIKLVPHDFAEIKIINRVKKNKYLPDQTTAAFWSEKSKAPYLWGDFRSGGFPWIGFVGYEIHYKGDVRVRKKSLDKEIKKQQDTIKKIEDAVINDRRVNGGTIIESAINRLIGMSIGRVGLWNYHVVESEMCWKSGFVELNANKYSIKQIKKLDYYRSKLYYKLKDKYESIKDIKKFEDSSSKRKTKSRRQIIDFNKAFSYYYHIIEKEK